MSREFGVFRQVLGVWGRMCVLVLARVVMRCMLCVVGWIWEVLRQVLRELLRGLWGGVLL